jgi:hypothetical protein
MRMTIGTVEIALRVTFGRDRGGTNRIERRKTASITRSYWWFITEFVLAESLSSNGFDLSCSLAAGKKNKIVGLATSNFLDSRQGDESRKKSPRGPCIRNDARLDGKLARWWHELHF